LTNKMSLRRYVKDIIYNSLKKAKVSDPSEFERIASEAYEDLKCFIERD
jgi:hypothetical protein